VEKACNFSSFAPDCTVHYVAKWNWLQYPICQLKGNPKHFVTQMRILAHLPWEPVTFEGISSCTFCAKDVKRQLHTPVLALTLTEALDRTVYAIGIECGRMSFLGFFFVVVLQFLASYHFIIFGYASNITLACSCDPAAVLQCVLSCDNGLISGALISA